MNELLNIIDNDTLLIIPNNIKEKALELIRSNKKINIKIMSLDELIKRLTFDYDEETIYHLMNKYNINYDISKTYLDYIKYIDKDSDIEKIHNLYDIKNNIDSYLKRDNIFYKYNKSKKVIVYGYDYINRYQKKVLEMLDNVTIINRKYNNYKHNVYSFKNIEDEVIFVAENISKLLCNGIDINKIYLANIDNNYYSVINRIFSMYNIPYNISDKLSIYETEIGKFFLNNYSNNLSEVLDKIKSSFDMNNDTNYSIYKSILSIVNKFYFIDDYLKVKDNIINVMKKTNVNIEKYDNAINEINLVNNIINDDEYVFLLGFNLNSIPNTNKDEDYLNDDIKPDVLEKSYEINIINKNMYSNIIGNIKNLFISYKEKSINEEFYPSLLINELGYEVINNSNKYSLYSSKINKYRLSKNIDNLIKYNEQNDNISLLYNNYDIPYSKYSNKYSYIDSKKIRDYLNNTLTLSYSSMNNYYNCSFRFYLSSILKLDIFEDRLSTYIGSLLHYILSKAFLDNFDFDKCAKYYLENNPYQESYKNNYFINKVLDDLKEVINTINYQNSLGNMNEAYYEKEIIVNKSGLLNTKFKGFIDKLLIKDNYAVIIDYKTYDINISLKYLPYGIRMQLPVYLYLTKNINKDYEIIGFYLQNILGGLINKDYKKDYKKQLNDSLKLSGYTIDQEDKISIFDTTYNNSELISGMKTSEKGFYSYTKVLSDNDINDIINITDKKIDECIDSIGNAKFDINPKQIKDKIVGCDLCKFKDICYMTNNDVVKIEEE